MIAAKMSTSPARHTPARKKTSKGKGKHKAKVLTFLDASQHNDDSYSPPPVGKAIKLYIKNMVSLRCKLVVKSEMEKLKLKYAKVELGEVEMLTNLPAAKRDLLK